MRKGGERRVRHDVGAKAKSLPAADQARGLAESAWLLKHARVLIDEVARQAGDLDEQMIESVAHDLVRRAAAQRKANT